MGLEARIRAGSALWSLEVQVHGMVWGLSYHPSRAARYHTEGAAALQALHKATVPAN